MSKNSRKAIFMRSKRFKLKHIFRAMRSRTMRIPEKISFSQYSNFIQNTVPLAFDKQGEQKVLLNSDNQVIKLFPLYPRPKHWFVSRAKRFLRIAQKLRALNIKTVDPNLFYYCRSQKKELILYPLIPGKTVREVARDNPLILKDLARFVAHLHHLGIYFRGAHLGNVLYIEKDRFALIDIGNMRFKISIRRRVKNLLYMMNSPADARAFENFGRENFIECYLKAARLKKREMQLFQHHLMSAELPSSD